MWAPRANPQGRPRMRGTCQLSRYWLLHGWVLVWGVPLETHAARLEDAALQRPAGS